MSYAYTVALCTHNHLDRLTRTLTDLTRLQSPQEGWELLFIDNGCIDGTSEFLPEYDWPEGWSVRIVREDKLGLSNARNRAITEARGEYVIFMDDDETVDPDWLCAYERLIVDKQPDAFGGRIRVLFEDMRPAWLTDELLGFLGELNRSDEIIQLVDSGTFFHGGNFGIRKSICDAVGAFDSSLGRKGTDNTGGEEVDFYRRLISSGAKVWWTPEAIIHHRIQMAKLSRSYFLDLHYRQGRSDAIRRRGNGSRLPPKYLYGQLLRAITAAWSSYLKLGRNASLRKEMNVTYFLGIISGWMFGPQMDGQ